MLFSMMLEIKIEYPKADEAEFTIVDIGALRHLERVINEHAFVLYSRLGTLNFEWERDDDAGYPTHARLITKVDRREIFSKPIEFLRKCTLDQFNDILIQCSFELPCGER